MNNAKRRLEKLEQHDAVQNKSGLCSIIYLIYYETDFLPDVFEKPLEDWKLFMRAADNNRMSSIIVDPYAEARLRGGGLALCPVSRYLEWKLQQNKQLKPKLAPEIVMYAQPGDGEIGQNCTNPDVLR